MTTINQFEPDWASAPGDTIADILADGDLSATEFANSIGRSPEYVDDLLQGRATITIAAARELERVLGASVEFWMSRDFQYREDVSRLNATNEDWVRELPIGDMIGFGWLRPVPRPSDEVNACLRFFDVPTVSAWHQKYSGVETAVALRTSQSFESRPASIAAWIRQGEIAAEDNICRSWDAERFEDSLSAIRSLAQKKNPEMFIPRLREYCAGVAVAVVRAPNGCRASGAARLIPS